MKNSRNIKLKTYDDIFNAIGNISENDIRNIDINMLVDFRDHPFKIIENEEMEELLKSVIEYGILMPIIVRPLGEQYEIISGHRRKYCAVKAGLSQIPCIVKDMSYDDAVFAMIDSNIQRKNILPSEKAFSYKMKFNAIKRRGERTDLLAKKALEDPENFDPTLRLRVDKLTSADIVGKDYNDSGRNVQRYMRLTELTPMLLDAVDKNKLNFGAGVALSYLTKEEQYLLEDIIKECGKYPTIIQSKKLKAASGDLNSGQIRVIIFGEPDTKQVEQTKKQERKPIIISSGQPSYINLETNRIKKYFPDNYSIRDIEEAIIAMLEKGGSYKGSRL